MGRRINFVGWYDRGNCGDEAFKAVHRQLFPDCEINWFVEVPPEAAQEASRRARTRLASVSSSVDGSRGLSGSLGRAAPDGARGGLLSERGGAPP